MDDTPPLVVTHLSDISCMNDLAKLHMCDHTKHCASPLPKPLPCCTLSFVSLVQLHSQYIFEEKGHDGR